MCNCCGVFMTMYAPEDASDATLSLARHKAKQPAPASTSTAGGGRELTVEQFSALTGIPPRTIRQRCKDGTLPATKRGTIMNARPIWRIPEGATDMLPQPATKTQWKHDVPTPHPTGQHPARRDR
jgi:hypothetical protein